MKNLVFECILSDCNPTVCMEMIPAEGPTEQSKTNYCILFESAFECIKRMVESCDNVQGEDLEEFMVTTAQEIKEICSGGVSTMNQQVVLITIISILTRTIVIDNVS
ncbi:hypothetical protein LOTGIDRAFT_229728 [Lottia gigantea]|uniref:Uncharacterized protein n=1 Tax=Lottia gigantea TaxID=225164 RepID=V3ZJS6_LOTGI|nr:hypothetical protein LOTGIDRAFT_229728 [Lottia gigantea]ESO82630.1 hypothetical protein LOTGIDRAFT_229728 [Lottia gigantea]